MVSVGRGLRGQESCNEEAKKKRRKEEEPFKVERSKRNLEKRDYTTHAPSDSLIRRSKTRTNAKVEETRRKSIFRNKINIIHKIREKLQRFKPSLAEGIVHDKGSSRPRRNGHGGPIWARPRSRERTRLSVFPGFERSYSAKRRLTWNSRIALM